VENSKASNLSQVNQPPEDFLPMTTGSVRRAVAGYGIVVVFIGLCAYYFYTHSEDFLFLADLSFPDLVAAALSVAAAFVAGMFQLKPVFDHFRLSMRFWELAALSTTSSLGNLVLPMRGGSAALAIYLKKVHGMSYRDFSLTYAGIGILTVLTSSALALISLGVMFVHEGFFELPITVLVAGLFGLCVILIAFPPRLVSRGGRIRRVIAASLDGWHALTSDRLLLVKSSAALIVVLLCFTSAFYFLYRALGAPLPFFAVLVTLSVGNIANLVPITPGSLGIFDAVTIQIPLFFGLDTARSMTATVLFRTLSFVWTLGAGIPAFFYLSASVRRFGARSK